MSGNSLRNFGSRYISMLTQVWSGTSRMVTNSEELLQKTLQSKFPLAKNITVSDISGGCGSMYEIFVETSEFKGLSTVKQHKLITEILKDEIKNMHGLRIRTAIAEK
ncbi:bolA-like protein 3 [Anopheles ziemanni]|uniref:bolA-like protein 3 n=1 Tax=Anopheles coustani TaxID=139045 RepID=UPI002657F295|nr:bolA-like protein 3 [Anopheles coustani]XP_058167022.1 bolA-like protein 3 [Anopheles ziemanni]